MNTCVSLQATLDGRLRRLKLFPLHALSARTGTARWLHTRRTARSQVVLRRRGHDTLIASRDAEALPQDAADLVYLYDTISRQRPVRCIELGSGQSTVFIAQALHDLGSGHLWSLGADARWIENSEQSLPDHLRPFVTFLHSPAIVHRDYGVAAFRYSVIPAGEWDFVLIDGPALTPEVLLSTDLIDLRLAPGATGMIDHRWRSAVMAKEVAGDRLRLRFMPSLESFSIETRRPIRLHSARSLVSRTKAAIVRLTDKRHREFYAQRKATDPDARALMADKLADQLPHTLAERPEGADTLERNGFFELGRMLTPGQITDVRNHFKVRFAHDLKRRHLGKFIAPDCAPPASHGAEYSHRDVIDAPHLLGVANDPRIVALVESYLGATPVIAALRVWWTLPTSDRQPEETEFFHRDMDDLRFLKLFVYLTDVADNSGPHVFSAGSHRKDVLTGVRRLSERQVLEVLGQETLVRFVGAAGTAFVEATYGIHRATPPTKRPRMAFQALYTLRPTIYGPATPLRRRNASEADFSRYTNRIYLKD